MIDIRARFEIIHRRRGQPFAFGDGAESPEAQRLADQCELFYTDAQQKGAQKYNLCTAPREGHGSADVAAAVSSRCQVCVGGEKGNLRLIARYIVLPSGRRINVPADLSRLASPRAMAFRRHSNSKRFPAKADPKAAAKKFAARRRTA